MTAVAPRPTRTEMLSGLIMRIGHVSPDRIRLWPPIGTATEADLLALPEQDEGRFELVEGVLVQKAMGFRESALAASLIYLIKAYLQEHKLGLVTAPDGFLRLAPGLVRGPDVAFISRDRLPGGQIPKAAIPAISPDVAVEIISSGNTPAEMALKLREYFSAGVSVVWYLYPDERIVEVYRSTEDVEVVAEDGFLDGGELLPGLRISVREWLEGAEL